MIQVDMQSNIRTVFGKGPMRQLRMKDITPGNLYSGGTKPVALQFDTAKLFKNLLFIHGRNAIVTLEIEGDSKGKRHVLLQEIQKEPVSGKLLHVDFLEVDLKKSAQFTVPVEYTGTAKGVELGGELQIYKETVKLQGCPLDIPDVVQADITHLEQGGKGLTYSDLAIPANVKMLEKGEAVCAAVQ